MKNLCGLGFWAIEYFCTMDPHFQDPTTSCEGRLSSCHPLLGVPSVTDPLVLRVRGIDLFLTTPDLVVCNFSAMTFHSVYDNAQADTPKSLTCRDSLCLTAHMTLGGSER